MKNVKITETNQYDKTSMRMLSRRLYNSANKNLFPIDERSSHPSKVARLNKIRRDISIEFAEDVLFALEDVRSDMKVNTNK